MADPRLASYASLLVERCVDVQPGWQVLVRASPRGEAARRGGRRRDRAPRAYALPRLSFARSSPWLAEAPEELLGTLAEIDAYELDNADCFIVIDAPENTREGSDISPERLMLRQQATRPHAEPFFAGEKPWVGCQFPTPALAQDAGMGLRAYEDFLYGAVLVDWDALAERMREIGARFDAAGEVRDHRRRHRSHLQPRRPLRPRGRDRREHARRRGLLQPGRGLGAAARSPSRSTRPATAAAPSRTSGSASRAAASSTRRRRPTRTSC